MYSGIPVTALVDGQGVLHGYEFWANNERTYAITRFLISS